MHVQSPEWTKELRIEMIARLCPKAHLCIDNVYSMIKFESIGDARAWMQFGAFFS